MAHWIMDSSGSVYNYLSEGCKICMKGAGLVLFITGRCDRDCFYCPISYERKDKDVVFANERPVNKLEDILSEAKAIGALGTGITGGEPLLRLDFLLEAIRALKSEFGPAHHIHLYTGTRPSQNVLEELAKAGLDEIRFHPHVNEKAGYDDLTMAMKEAKSQGIKAGIEIPAFCASPGIIKAVRDADAFLNVNELEFSETNFDRMAQSGFEAPEIGCGAIESERIAKENFLVEDIKVHYCPSSFKDAVQLRERLKRRAMRCARPLDSITDDGTLVHGIIEGNIMGALLTLLDLEVPSDMYAREDSRIDIAAAILEDIADELKEKGCKLAIIEKYPTDDGLVVERIPL